MLHRSRSFLATAALAALTACATTNASTGSESRPQPQSQEGAATGELPPGMDAAMMAEMMRLATPGPEHAELIKGAGEWELTYRMRMAPDAPWTESKGTMSARPLLDGRYLLEEHTSEVMGMPMKGLNIVGFDNSTGEFTSMWADNFSTWWLTSRGKHNADGDIDFRGTMKDVAGERPFRMLVHNVSDDESVVHMFDTIPPQGEVETMQITCRRKK